MRFPVGTRVRIPCPPEGGDHGVVRNIKQYPWGSDYLIEFDRPIVGVGIWAWVAESYLRAVAEGSPCPGK